MMEWERINVDIQRSTCRRYALTRVYVAAHDSYLWRPFRNGKTRRSIQPTGRYIPNAPAARMSENIAKRACELHAEREFMGDV